MQSLAKFPLNIYLLSTMIEKTKSRKKRPGITHLKKTLMSANGRGHLTEGDEVENLLNAPKQWSQFDIKTTFVL